MARKTLTTFAAIALALILLPAAASAQFACFPTCDVTDARFLSMAGSGLATFNGNELNFIFSVPPSQPQFMFGIFDGENSGDWDSTGAASMVYTLFADPTAAGTGTVFLDSWTDADFIDNGWRDFTIAHSPAALSPSGNFFYRLQIQLVGADPLAWTNFKVRTQDTNGFELQPQAFSFSAFLFTGNDLATVYPAFPALTPTSYDGTWEFFVRTESSANSLSFWDGDLDYGQADCNLFFQDTDDPDTPGAPFLPPWAAPTNVPEGIAVGLVKPCGQVTGDPADDATDFAPFQRAPSVNYTVFTPMGFPASNSNPSGNLEWEAFTLTTGGGGDVAVPALPAGTYTIQMGGMDLSNFNSWRLPGTVVGICVDGTDCTPRLNPYLVGDTVFFDPNGDGTQDPGEPGIPGVLVNLIDAGGEIKGTETTDSNGEYTFQVRPGMFTVEVDSSNFGPGGALEGLTSTTGNSLTRTVVDANILTYDFGYEGNSSIGDFVWYDANGNGLQDDGPDSGLGGVEVNLTEAGPDMTFGTPDDVLFPSMTTAGNGFYDFTSLIPGLYRVDVNEATLPAGVSLTTANEPLDVTLALNEDFNDADFGYVGGTGSLGDRVWLDRNGDGNQDSGEPGLDGVSVTLFADLDGDGNDEFTDTATTVGGLYSFTNLPEGSYRVEVDVSTLPAAVTQTFDLDGLATANEATASLSDGQNRTDVDFGYVGPGSIGDRVWLDLNGDGVQDPNEPGINGATVELRDGNGVLIDSQSTSGDGNYLFDGLLLDTYTVTVVPATLPGGVNPTFDLDGIATPHTAQVALTPGREIRDDVDFGYRGTGTLGDRIWADYNGDGVQDPGEPGLNGVTVTLRDGNGNVLGTQVTSGDGDYDFTGLPAGNYTVDVDPSTLPADFVPTFDLDGIATPHTTAATLGAGEDKNDVDFGYRGNSSIGDRVWRDDNGDGVQDPGEPGLNGVTVTLRDSNGNVVATQVTSGDGGYLFAGLFSGDYTVDVDPSTLPAGLAPTFDLDGIATPHTASLTLGANEDRTDVDYGYQGTGSVGDRIWDDLNGDGVQDPGEAGINGVTVTLRDGNGDVIGVQVTSGDGTYNFPNLAAGNYTVDVDPTTLPPGLSPTFDLDGTATPHTASFALGAGEDKVDVDFGYRGNGSIGDRVWLDSNGDGIQGPGELGINGVTVTLRDSGGNVVGVQVTSGDGLYLFPNLPVDTYTVTVDPSTLPPGLAATFDLDGIATPDTATVPLAASQDRTDVDFGYRGAGSIGDRVWNDTNGDGIQDLGEIGINNVTVNLLDAGGVLIATTTTTGDGLYLFPNLPAGGYTVVVDDTTLPAGVSPTFDLDGIATPHQASLVLGPGELRDDVDFGYNSPSESICLPTIDFETNAAGGSLSTGQIIDDEWSSLGVTVTTNDPANHPAMIFDSSSPSGGDYDLGTSNQAFGGPGVGSGGGPGAGANANPLGKILIISEDGDQSDPDDNFAGGTIIFTFATPVELASVDILDIDSTEAMGEIRAYDEGGNLITTVGMQQLGNNSFQTVLLGVSFVSRLEIEFPKSGAVAGITFCVDEETEICLDKAIGDPLFTQSSGGHALWLPGVGSTRFIFSPVGTFTEDSDGTAQITGTVFDAADPSIGFVVSAQLSGLTTIAPPGSPKKELNSSAYSENGGPADSSTWRYYTNLSGTLNGIGGFVGAQLTINGTGPAFQAGVGANGKNVNNGASSWFTWSVSSQPSNGTYLPQSGQGDFNMDLVDCDKGTTGCVPGQVRDDFDDGFTGNTGADDWSGDWIENDPQSGGAGPNAGQVRVINGYLRLDDQPNTGGQPSLAREVDLSGASFATLRFDFDTSSGVDYNDAVTVEISDDGGATWTTLEVITGIEGEIWDDREFDISAFISAETQVRFRVSQYYGGDWEFLWVNFVEIEWGCDTPPPPTSSKEILFVVGDIWLNAGDTAIQTRLEGRGFNVTVMAAAEVVEADALARDLVLISSTSYSGDIGDRLTYTEVPIITWEGWLYDNLGMTGPTANTDYGTMDSETELDVLSGAPLGVANGTVTVTTSPQTYMWGKAGGEAIVFASLAGDPGWAAIFGYETGASMPGLSAPARRAGISFHNEAPAHLTGAGWNLFDGLVDWACEDDNGGGVI